MPTAADLVVNLLADTRKFSSGMDGARNEITRLNKSVDQVSKSTPGLAGGLIKTRLATESLSAGLAGAGVHAGALSALLSGGVWGLAIAGVASLTQWMFQFGESAEAAAKQQEELNRLLAEGRRIRERVRGDALEGAGGNIDEIRAVLEREKAELQRLNAQVVGRAGEIFRVQGIADDAWIPEWLERLDEKLGNEDAFLPHERLDELIRLQNEWKDKIGETEDEIRRIEKALRAAETAAEDAAVKLAEEAAKSLEDIRHQIGLAQADSPFEKHLLEMQRLRDELIAAGHDPMQVEQIVGERDRLFGIEQENAGAAEAQRLADEAERAAAAASAAMDREAEAIRESLASPMDQFRKDMERLEELQPRLGDDLFNQAVESLENKTVAAMMGPAESIEQAAGNAGALEQGSREAFSAIVAAMNQNRADQIAQRQRAEQLRKSEAMLQELHGIKRAVIESTPDVA